MRVGTTRYAALLRGINVGGHGRLPMADLRALLDSLGFQNVTTYLQSGQAAFDASGDEADTAAAIRAELAARTGTEIDVIVRSHDYLRAVVENCPFDADRYTGRQIHAAYASGPLDAERFQVIDPVAFAPERFVLGDRLIYLLLPDGAGRSKLAQRVLASRTLGRQWATARNWNTATRLAELTRTD